jgi:transmembrane sensor
MATETAETADKAREHIDVPWDEVRAARVHRRVLEAFREGPRAGEGPGRRAWILAAALVAAAALLLLRFASTAEVAPSVAYADGSRSWLHEEADMRVMLDTPSEVQVEQRSGRVRYEIEPRRERRFQVHAQGVTVTVLGTIFDVKVVDDQVEVRVERGRVQISQGTRAFVLEAGEQARVSATKAVPERAAPVEERVEPAPDAPLPESTVQTEPDVQSGGGGSPPIDAKSLLAQADAARGAGRLDDAAQSLRRLITSHPRDPRATIALFTLGQVERQRGHHAEAARAFERCGTGLRGDALAEAAAAWQAAGDGARARQAAQRYLATFPDGVHAGRMRAIAGE